MTRWLRRIRGTIGMGVTWALTWAVGGILIGITSTITPFLPWDAFFKVFDAPLPAFAIPGFFAGVFFSMVVGTLGRRSKLHELSVPRMAAWGAAAGLLLTAFPFVLVGVGMASRGGSNVGAGQIIAVITGPFMLLSAASAVITLKLARQAEHRELDGDSNDVADAPLTEGDERLVHARSLSETRVTTAQATPSTTSSLNRKVEAAKNAKARG